MHTTIDQNFNRHSWLIPSQTPDMKVFRRANLSYVDSDLSCDTFNILHITNGQAITEAEIHHALGYFKQNELAYCIWISAENLNEKVLAIFDKLGVKQQNLEPGMALDLSMYRPVEHPLHPHAAIIEDAQTLAEYAQVIAANWTPPDQNVIAYFQKTSDQYLDKTNQTILLVYRHHCQVVSTIEMFPSDAQTIGLYSLATLAAHRGKGIGTALLTFALNLAKNLGYQTAILQASEDGIGIYQKYGFKAVSNFFEFA